MAILIFLNTVLLALYQPGMDPNGPQNIVSIYLRRLIYFFFIVESGLTIFAERVQWFKSFWNIMDLCIAVFCILSYALGPSFEIARVVISLKLLKTIPYFPGMHLIVYSLLESLPHILKALGFFTVVRSI